MSIPEFLLAGAAVILVGAAAARAAQGLRTPALLLFLGMGLLLGGAGLGVRIDDPDLARDLGFAATAVILAEGGLTTRLSSVRRVLAPAISLATVGVVVSAVVVAAAVVLLFGTDWRTGLLLGAVVASTDAAAVFAVLRRLRLKDRPAALLEAESGFNDATAVALVVAFAAVDFGTTPWWETAAVIGYELLAGAALGVLVGLAGRWLLARIALPGAGLYPVAVLSLAIGAYAAAVLVHASGFLAVYLAALLLGSADLPHRRTVLGFTDGMAWLAQIGLFTLLGLLVVPAEIPGALGLGLVAAVVLLLLARPLSVLVSLLPFRFGVGEQAFLSWGGLRGAVPIVFATIPLSLQTPQAVTIFTATFLVVVVLTALQGPLLPWVAARTGMAEPDALAELEVESAPLDDMRALLLGLEVPDDSQLVGLTVADLRLPAGAVVTLVVRGGQTLVPDVYTRIRPGDRVLIVAAEGSRTATLERLRQVSTGGRLVGWRRSGGPDQAGDDLRRHPDQRQAAPWMRRAADEEEPRHW